ncbi:M60 family metallopeptidase [Flavonifractor plautii]|uniref:M60 family metallopeptidase n=1 Tax=Flavonifractor plautii TaxID=292800 RepID=UPI001FAF6B43|nr:M60 family metallopeptidase [Flavonifractor plautii]
MHPHRVISGLLSLAMMVGPCTAWLPAAAAASPQESLTLRTEQTATGSIALTLSFDLPQRADEVKSRDIRLTLTGSDKNITVSLKDGSATGADGLSVTTEALNTQGAPLTTEQQLGAYTAVVSGLPVGEYTMTVTGTGYASRTTPVTLWDYSQHVLMSTADGSFSLGDVTGDGAVTSADRAALDEQLGKTSALDTYDLNGDGVVDVTDLSYVNKMMDLEAEPRILSTTAIVSPAVDESAVTFTEGSAADLFTGETAVTLKPAQEAEELSIPIAFEDAVTMSEIAISSPSVDGAIQAGTAVVETEDGEILTLPFDISAPEGVHAMGRVAGQNVVTIDLGKKVPVKKVTITVTRVEGQAGEKPEYATVTQIEFLKDIVSEDAAADTQVKGLAATVGDGEVTLVWDSLPNVTGYTVNYGTSKNALSSSAGAGTNRITLSDLKNNTTYYFQVTAVSGDWSGTPSAILSATPLPASVPGAPSNLTVEPADGALRLNWGSTKDATYYQVYYREQGASEFIVWGGDTTATSAVITGLTNDTVYEVAVKAGNLHGTGPFSATASGTPKKEGFEMPALPETNRIDNSQVTSIVMADPSNVNWSMCPGFNVKTDLTDGDPNTYWIANNYWYNSSITYTFADTHSMNYVLVVPYLDSAYKNRIANYTVTLKGEDGQVLATYYRDGVNITGSDYYIFSFPETEGVKSLTLALGEKTGGPRVSISEIAFYESDTLSEDIAALFTDGTFTALKSSVQQGDITALQDRLSALGSFYLDLARLQDELNLAQALLDKNDSALGVVKQDFQSRSTAADQAFGQSASDLQPLGVTARAGSTVAIYAELPDDATVYVVPTQFYGESGVWKGTPVALKNGRNYITVEKIGSLTDTRGGVLYLTYSGSHPQQIKLQVRGDSNVYAMPVLELSGWYTMSESARKDAIRTYVQDLEAYVSGLSGAKLTTDIRNATEISTPSVLLSLPADQALSGLKGVGNDEEAMVEAMYQNVLAWEEELFIANKVQGIIHSDAALSDYTYPMTTRQNIRYMRMFAGAFMYAAGNHVGVEYGSTAALVQGKPTSATGAGQANGLFGWGIAHEIGHNMDKLGRAECTNNIYSLALQAWDGSAMTVNTRLTEDGRWEQIFDKVAQGRPGAANNVFVQLGMYWQLHLAYDGAGQPLAFYNAFFQAWKSGAYSGYSYDERVALIASQVADRNLTEFFTRWGMTLSDGVKDILSAYPAEERAIWYLNDASRTYRLQNGSAAEGTASVTAAVSDSKVTLTISHTDSANILGYEIRRNGTPIAFTTETTYVDDLGAANNLAYTYTVVPVDKLGNLGTATQSNEVRVAYDKTISADLYTLTRAEDGTITIAMKGGAAVPVTGIKVTGADLSGSYTVKVKADAGAEAWTTAKTGTLSGDTVVAYFNKPGVGPEDTRIWTYDAAVVEITGIPADADLALLDYPGDRVDFYEGATVGILKDAYGDIPAGTLVILGTYRGDPVYNYVEIQARYSTTPEAGEVTTIERTMSGEVYLLVEIPEDGAVSDTSDGFFIFVPNLEDEAALNAQDGVTDPYPLEIRANFYRTDDPNDASSKRLTSQTLWISFPDGGDDEDQVSLPVIELKSDLS